MAAIRRRARSKDQRLAEGRLDAVSAASTDAILRVDAEGVVSGWSAGAEALYGYEADEIIGRPLADLLGDGELDRVAEAIREEERLDEISEQRSREGNVFTAAITMIPSADPPEAIVAPDTWARSDGSERLRKVEATYRSLTEHLPLVTYVRVPGRDGDRRSSARRSTGSSATRPMSGSPTPASCSARPPRRPRRSSPSGSRRRGEARPRATGCSLATDAPSGCARRRRGTRRLGRAAVRPGLPARRQRAEGCGGPEEGASRRGGRDGRGSATTASGRSTSSPTPRRCCRRPGLQVDAAEAAALAVRDLADSCVVDVLGEDGSSSPRSPSGPSGEPPSSPSSRTRAGARRPRGLPGRRPGLTADAHAPAAPLTRQAARSAR